jgi:hypothetical protein
LKWKSYAEISNDYFEIQRSFDTTHFISIGKIDGGENSNKLNSYNFTEENALTGQNY